MIRLLLAEDQELIRTALAALLAPQDEFVVVVAVGRGDEVLAAGSDREDRDTQPNRSVRIADARGWL
jgi:DNA-binding NarL/FixJ family response regulator